MAIQFEMTDTFGGEANYCWVRRAHLRDRPASERGLIRLAKAWAGWAGVRCRKENWGETTALYPRRMCQVLFISYVEDDFAQGVRLD